MASLLILPPEMLGKICSHLCQHCHPPNTDSEKWFDSHENETRNAALAALSRTSRSLHQLAQPYLYHRPSASGRFHCLFRTLANHRDLAKQVRHLRIGDWNLRERMQILPRDHEVLSELAMKLSHGTEGYQIATVPAWLLPARLQEGQVYTDEDIGLLTNLIVLLVPNIQKLCIETYYDEYDGNFELYQPNSLPCLTDLVLEHGNTHGGIDLQDMKDIFAASPRLSHLRGWMVASMSSGIRHDGLRELHLGYSCLDSESFMTLMASFPFLESFKYYSGGSIVSFEEATPREMSDAIWQRRNTLKHLSLELGDSIFAHESDEDEVMRTLQDMQVLETLNLDTMAVYVETDDESTTDGNLFIDFLPVSLRSLSVGRPHNHIHQDILHLAKVATQRFPNLKEVKTWGLDRDEEKMLNQAFVFEK
ncbi:hypothetical protein ACJZ2D_007376 [Fusarium nematophilum]